MSVLWSTTHCYSIAKISKVKDLALIDLVISVFSLSSLHLLSKAHLKQSFCYTFLLTHNRLMAPDICPRAKIHIFLIGDFPPWGLPSHAIQFLESSRRVDFKV